MAFEQARAAIGEMTVSSSASQLQASEVLKAVGFIGVLGLLFVVGGTVAMLGIVAYAERWIPFPVPLIFGLGGLFSVVMICRYLINLIKSLPANVQVPKPAPAQPVKGTTNRSLSEGHPYFSVTEQNTQQFEPQHRTNQ